MLTNAKGLDLIKHFEGLSLKGYLCPAGKPTIGFGHTGPEVRVGQTISIQQANALLQQDVARTEHGVTDLLGAFPATSDQFSAMVCLAYNIGLGKFAGSTVLREHKLHDYSAAADAFALWDECRGRVIDGLVARRNAEAALYRGLA